jgi:hypothetical protein
VRGKNSVAAPWLTYAYPQVPAGAAAR